MYPLPTAVNKKKIVTKKQKTCKFQSEAERYSDDQGSLIHTIWFQCAIMWNIFNLVADTDSECIEKNNNHIDILQFTTHSIL